MGLNKGTAADGISGAPAISVVLPVYNGERFLRAALDSILGQTFTDFELIAVDDCSTDDSPAILADYAARDDRLRIITQPANCKLPASLNAGFAQARGSWWTWTSDDNVLRPEMLEVLVAERDRAPQADVIYSDYRIIDERGESRSLVTVGTRDDLVMENAVGCSFLYRRSVDEALGGYDETLFGVEDYDFWLRAAQKGFVFHPVHRELYLYRRHGGSLTDQRARAIKTLVADLLMDHIDSIDLPRRRAQALLSLATRDPFTFRIGLVIRAMRDDLPTVLGAWRPIAGWLKASLASRIR
ncbi:glycosyltransferase family 2 protein [Qipengyuania zhejiangensis]|uniref:glycosyltransferase family 2 protein n=1 Tax=Qipengyuania zhejiangensis TaxID=3077782 RepID=UPI002D7A01DF|nr:glycosyltransferase [Qipengyuania sp. Z2]